MSVYLLVYIFKIGGEQKSNYNASCCFNSIVPLGHILLCYDTISSREQSTLLIVFVNQNMQKFSIAIICSRYVQIKAPDFWVCAALTDIR